MQDQPHLQAILKILTTGHWLTDEVNQALKPFDISEAQFNVLRILRGQKGCPIAVQDIQERMIQRSSNVTRLVDKLIDKRLVERSICLENRRKMDITITKQGLALLKKLDQVVLKLHQPLSSRLTDKEARQLADLLNKLKPDQ